MTGNVIRFPDTTLAQLRRQLRYCRTERMFNRWGEKFTRLAHLLDLADRAALAEEWCARKAELAKEVA